LKRGVRRFRRNGGISLSEVRDANASVDLKVESQCNQARLKSNKMLGLIKRTSVVKTPEAMLNLYKTLVRPQLEYCISAWSPHDQKDKKLHEKVQHRFTRMITSL